MSVHKSGNRLSLQAERALIAKKLVLFSQHKRDLVDSLQNMYERGLKTRPFEYDKSWDDLTYVAESYFRLAQIRQRALPAAERMKCLQQLAQTLSRARKLSDKAKRDVGSDLFRGWCAEAKIAPVFYPLSSEGSVLTRVFDDIENAIANLGSLERAALRAAKNMRAVRGRPKNTEILPPECVRALERIYRTRTGLRPGTGKGPFARFVYDFLTAIGQRVVKYESVVDMIKAARL
jgi:hypothetical protein